jgi:hypothetical protein
MFSCTPVREIVGDAIWLRLQVLPVSIYVFCYLWILCCVSTWQVHRWINVLCIRGLYGGLSHTSDSLCFSVPRSAHRVAIADFWLKSHPSWWKNQPWLVRVEGCTPPPFQPITLVALTETFLYLELCSTCLKEGLGRSKPATNSRTSTLTHCVDFYYIQALLNCLL